MTTENKTAASGVPAVPPVPPPPARIGSVEAPATAPEGDGVRAGAVKAARAALATARDAAKRVQTPRAADANQGASARPASVPPQASSPRPEMHYTATPDAARAGAGHPGGPAVPPAGYGGAPQPGPQPVPAAAASSGPRRVRLTLSRVDPWSVMKLAFLLAVAVGIMTVVATAVFWFVVDGLGVFATIQEFITEAVGQQTDIDLAQIVAFDRVVSLATLVAVVNVVLLTAIATIMALLYNITAALVGGVHVTLTDD